MKVLDLNPTNYASALQSAAQVIQEGGLLIFPTETTYGAGVDATNPSAVAKLLRYKSRREGKPLSIAVTNIEMAEKYVNLTDSARALYRRFLPGPVTVVSADKGILAPGVASEFHTVGVRIPDYQFVRDLVFQLGTPITATSANASDAKRPYNIKDIFDHLSQAQKDLIDLVIDAGQLPSNPPSTVIDTTAETPIIFRQGSVTIPASDVWKSATEADTKALAGKLLLKWWNQVRETGIVIGLDGSLGTGKTVFTKGLAQFLGISEVITSPTYTYLEEYSYQRHQTSGCLAHLDVWKIDSPEALKRLAIPDLIKPGNIVVIEWFSQIEPWLTPELTASIPLIRLHFQETPAGRTLHLYEPTPS